MFIFIFIINQTKIFNITNLNILKSFVEFLLYENVKFQKYYKNIESKFLKI